MSRLPLLPDLLPHSCVCTDRPPSTWQVLIIASPFPTPLLHRARSPETMSLARVVLKIIPLPLFPVLPVTPGRLTSRGQVLLEPVHPLRSLSRPVCSRVTSV